MTPKEKNPAAALAGATDREINVKTIAAVSDDFEISAENMSFQSAFVAQRYRLSPCIARLVCRLAQIGGRMA